ncbi:peptide chain release factor N(5)-glutamine methyltransferase [Chloroflexota bacterium]
MTIKEALVQTHKTLIAHHIEEPKLESQLLLHHATNLSKDKLYFQYNRELTDKEALLLDSLIQRRLKGEPIAYILGHKEFFGLEFQVDPSVLIPRPETELLAEKAIDFAIQHNVSLIADVGTGSGAIATALAHHLPEATIYAVDVSSDALKTAQINCHKNDVSGQVQLLHGSLLEPLPEPVDLIIANLPYVKNEDWERLPGEIKAYEPKSALAGGTDGLDVIKELLAVAKDKLRPNGAILLEIGSDQGATAYKLAKKHFAGAQINLIRDLAGLDRVISITT